MTAAQSVVGVLLLLAGTVVIGYCALTDLLGGPADRHARLWARPVLLVPTALALLLAGALVLETA